MTHADPKPPTPGASSTGAQPDTPPTVSPGNTPAASDAASVEATSAAGQVPAPQPNTEAGSARRIVSMDGGGLMSLLTLTLLERLEAERPGTLRATDLFAGTSAGGVNALLLAAQEDPADALGTCVALWDGTVPIWHVVPKNLVGAMTGRRAIYSNDQLRAAMTALMGETRLGDLPHKVCILAFDITGRDDGVWSAAALTNFGPAGEHGRNMRVVDAALATMALPMTFPISGGFVDGGLFAENPALSTLSEVLMAERMGAGHLPGPHGATAHFRVQSVAAANTPSFKAPIDADVLSAIRLLSLGTGSGPEHLDVLNAPWGWADWMADAKDPGRLMAASRAAVAHAADLACQQILGTEHYHRLDPLVDPGVPHTLDLGARGDTTAIESVCNFARNAAGEVDIAPTVGWLERGGWP